MKLAQSGRNLVQSVKLRVKQSLATFNLFVAHVSKTKISGKAIGVDFPLTPLVQTYTGILRKHQISNTELMSLTNFGVAKLYDAEIKHPD